VAWWVTPGIPKLARLIGRGLRRWTNVVKGPWWTRVLKVVSLAAVLAALGFGAFDLFQDRSDWVQVSVEAPAPTPLQKDATYSVLRVKFSSSAARVDLADKTVGEGISLTPAVKGIWKWQGDDELIFSPSEDWSCDTAYHVTLAPSLFSDGLKLTSSALDFQTAPFQAAFDEVRFEVDPTNQADRRVRATVVFNYPVDVQSLKGRLEFRVDGGEPLGNLKAVGLDVTFDEFQGKAFLKSDRLPVPKGPVSVTLIARGDIRSRGGAKTLGSDLTASVQVPGLYDMVRYQGLEAAVVRNDNYEYEQTLTLGLSGDAFPDKIAAAMSLWLLPADRTGVPGAQDEKNHAWAPEEVDKRLLARSQKLDFEPLPVANNTAQAFSFKYKAPAGRMVYAEFAGRVEAFGGYVIKDPLRTVVQVPEIPKSLEIMHSGSILSLNGDKTISVVSNDVRTVRFRASRLFPDQVNHLITQTSGPFSQPTFRDVDLFSELDMSSVYSEVRDLPEAAPGAVQYQSFNFSSYLTRAANPQEKYGLFLFNVSEYDKDKKAEVGVNSQRFILITDLGLLAKRNADGSYEVYVQDIRTGKPRAGATVEVLGRNGVSVFTQDTDAKGHVHAAGLDAFTQERQPVVFTARSGGDLSFLPLNREDRFLTYSRFDVGGERGATDPEKVTAFVFSDRGLYRPGDKIHVAAIVKAGDWARALGGLPLELKIYDPRGVEVQKSLVKLPPSGFLEADYKTFDTSTTGIWRFELALVKDDRSREFLGNTSVRVEEFVPDRLTITSKLGDAGERAWVPFSSLQADVHLANLYGLPAAGNAVKASFRLVPQALSFPLYPDYRFDDAFTTDKFHDETLPAGTTDPNGDAHFGLDLTKFEPATFQVIFSVEGQEKQGGRGVASESTLVVSPLEWILGWKADGRLDYIPKGMARSLQLLAINPMQKPVAVPGLKYAVDEVRFLSVLTKKEDGSYQYQSVRKKYRVSSGTLDVPAAGRAWPLDSSSPGDFEFSVLDGSDRVVAKAAYSIIGKGNLSRSLDRDAELQIKLNKSDFNPGEDVELQIKAPYAGSGLITIEREKVYATQWFTTDSNASIQHITVPAGLEGSAYVNVSFIRAIDSPEIYMSPLSYGVAPFRVSIAKRALELKLTVPEDSKPGKPFVIRYKADRPSKVVIYAVDEGILQVARYQTPKPLEFFFKKRALEVSTSQILDQILPEFSIVRNLLAMGGDAEALRSRQNPFKRKSHEPVAFWSGIVDAGPEERSVSYTVPSYFNGTVRVMAVAVSDDAVGVAEKKALVRNDFLITPSLPAFVAPGDEFLMGVTVANNAPVGTKGPPVLRVSGQNGLTVVGEAQKTLTVERNAETTVWFRLKAGPAPGSAQVAFSVSAGGLASDLVEELSIRPAVVWAEKLTSGILRNGGTKVDLPRRLLPQLRKLTLSLSYRPAALNTGLLGYLSDYPYGCTEQILSKAFPALVLLSDPTSTVDRTKTEQSVAEAIKVLGSRQNDDGGIGLWAASTDADDFITVYAVHFLTEAAARGYKAGDSIRQAALDYLTNHIGDASVIERDPEAAAYAAWVLALNGQISTSLVLDVRRTLEKQGGDWKKDPAVLYLAGASSLLKQQDEADRLLGDYGDGKAVGDDAGSYDSDLYRMGLRLYINARYRSGNPLPDDNPVLEAMVGLIGQDRFSTWSSSWAVLAFQAYGERAPQVTPGQVQAYGKTADGTERALAVGTGPVVTVAYDPDVVSIRLNNNAGVPLYWQAVQSGFDAAPPTKAVTEGLEVFREYVDADGKVVTTAQRGQTLTAVVKVRSTGKTAVDDVAVVDLLPGGFELALDQQANQSFDQTATGNMVRDYGEAREDRVIVFGQAGTKLTEFRYPVKAVTAGTFVLPVVEAEAMYDRTVRARTAAGSFTVTE